jgi:hypothetical protein
VLEVSISDHDFRQARRDGRNDALRIHGRNAQVARSILGAGGLSQIRGGLVGVESSDLQIALFDPS